MSDHDCDGAWSCDTCWAAYQERCWNELDPVKREQAADYLRTKLHGQLEELRQRITEKPHRWLEGRDDTECWSCEGRGWRRVVREEVLPLEYVQDPGLWHATYKALLQIEANVEHVECAHCRGTKRAPELPLHFSWGMQVRNLLRSGGFDETYMDILNWDDYYAPVVERAVGMR
jgi:hypothetical protein